MRSWVVAVAALTMWSTASVSAQESAPAPFLMGVMKDVALDATTYAPGLITYGAMRLDWDSSQVFFRNGYVEHNERYTVSGTSNSASISRRAGNRRIAADSLTVLQLSVAHNVTARMIERGLLRRYPTHRKLVRIVARIERIAAASYVSYVMSAMHLRQWQKNDRLARQLGYR